MQINNIYNFTSIFSIEDAEEIQNNICNKINLECPFKSINEIKSVAGCSVVFTKDDKTAYSSVVVLDFSDLKIIEKVSIKITNLKFFPYIPGLLAFREGPLLLMALKKLNTEPDIILVNGHGIAHQKRAGLATHIGLFLNKPTIGCAKEILYGFFIEPPPSLRGAFNYIKDESGDIIGIVLITKPYTKPIFISPGYMIDIELAGDIVLELTKKYRFPEPLRIAIQEAKKTRDRKSQ